MSHYETLWTHETRNFRVELAYTDEPDPDSSWYDDETREKIESGEWSVYLFRVRVLDAHGNEIASDYLGDSVYADPADFCDHRAAGRANREYAAKGMAGRCGSYFVDMVHRACDEARAEINRRPVVRLRQPKGS